MLLSDGAMIFGEAPSLADLPVGLLLCICQILVDSRSGSPRDVVTLALAGKALTMTLCAADELWLFQCKRLGWG
jgi:hypothetical protein